MRQVTSLDEKIAFDVALLPSGQIEQLAFRLNAQLSGVRAGIYPRFEPVNGQGEGCFPHLTLAQGFFYKKDEEKIKKRLRRVAKKIGEEHGQLSLKCTHLYANELPNRARCIALAVEKTPALEHLHQEVMVALQSLVTYGGNLSELYRKEEMLDEVTLFFISNYRTNFAFQKFNPHITLGIGRGKDTVLKQPLEEPATVLALAQLGNYCTVRKILAQYALTER